MSFSDMASIVWMRWFSMLIWYHSLLSYFAYDWEYIILNMYHIYTCNICICGMVLLYIYMDQWCPVLSHKALLHWEPLLSTYPFMIIFWINILMGPISYVRTVLVYFGVHNENIFQAFSFFDIIFLKFDLPNFIFHFNSGVTKRSTYACTGSSFLNPSHKRTTRWYSLSKMDRRLSSPIHLSKKYFLSNSKERHVFRLSNASILDRLNFANMLLLVFFGTIHSIQER